MTLTISYLLIFSSVLCFPDTRTANRITYETGFYGGRVLFRANGSALLKACLPAAVSTGLFFGVHHALSQPTDSSMMDTEMEKAFLVRPPCTFLLNEKRCSLAMFVFLSKITNNVLRTTFSSTPMFLGCSWPLSLFF